MTWHTKRWWQRRAERSEELGDRMAMELAWCYRELAKRGAIPQTTPVVDEWNAHRLGLR